MGASIATSTQARSKPAIGKLSYRIDEAVSVSGIGRSTIYENIGNNKLPSFTVGRRRLIHHDDLVAFIDSFRGAA